MSIPACRLGPRFNALVSVISRVPVNSRAGRLPAFATFEPNSDVERGDALRVPVIREIRGPLVIPVSMLLYFA